MDNHDSLEVSKLCRTEARSHKVDYGAEVVLYESTKSRVVFVPFYIPHSTRTELVIKLITYQKSPPPHDWVIKEDKTISLRETAARQLLHSLRQHLAIAEQDSEGEFIVIRVEDGMTSFSDQTTETVAHAMIQVLQREDITRHLVSKDLGVELTNAFRGAIRIGELKSAVSQLRNNLDEGIGDEQVYQQWCENHSWAFGNSYIARDDIRSISTGDNIDLLLPSTLTGYRDIIELKRPDMELLLYDTSHKDYYFSSDVSKAIGQCHRYLDIFQEVAKNGLLDREEIVSYHPRAVIVIGRSAGWPLEKVRALHGLNCRLAQISIMTYDQLLAQGERMIEVLGIEGDEPDIPDFDIPDFVTPEYDE